MLTNFIVVYILQCIYVYQIRINLKNYTVHVNNLNVKLEKKESLELTER